MITIKGYSTAMFATWYFWDELGLLFDAGDGLIAGLLQKSRKVRHVFVSHPDRDHLTGLFQFNQLNARGNMPVIHYPKDSESFPYMAAFMSEFDPHASGTRWVPVAAGETVWLGERIGVEAIRNGHIPAPPDVTKSLSFKVFELRQKLRPELLGLPNEQIKQLIQEKGKEATMITTRFDLLGYSGDTPVEDLGRWNGCKVLIHEATFLGGSYDAKPQPHWIKHSTLDKVMEMVAQSDIEHLILGHFSSRYDAVQIDAAIAEYMQRLDIRIPVYRVLPGEIAEFRIA